MSSTYLNKNIVLVGAFKPSNFDKYFFIKNEIIAESEFLEDSVFLPDLVIASSKSLLIEILPNKFTATFKDVNFNIMNFFKPTVLEKLDSNTFGFNFKRVIFIDDLNSSKKYFKLDNSPLNDYFSGDNAAFGYYASDVYLNSRLKLNILPQQLQRVDNSEILNALEFNYNFHFENENYKDAILIFDEFENFSLTITNNYG